MPGANMGMAGFSQPDAQNLNMAGRPSGNFGSGMPLLNAPAYDNLTPKGKPKDYKEGGQGVKFDTFHGTHDKLKALLFLQQFDVAFAGGNFTEASKIREAATLLKTNALQWWIALLNQGVVPSTWVQFKQTFAPAWITNTFEVDVMTAWNQLSAINCESLEEYNAKFWDALLPVSSFKMVTLAEQIEKYCYGLPKGIKKYCTKTRVMNMAQLMENAEVADDLIQGKPDEDGFKTRCKEPQGRQFSAKGNVTSRLSVPPFKKKPFAGKGHFAPNAHKGNLLDKDDKSDRKGKKPKPSARLVPDLFASSFHPQTDWQSEIANSVVLDLLKSYISDQKTQWERYLPLVEFAYNNTIHSSTRKAPFEIVEGAMKVPSFLSTKDKIFEADEYTRDLDTAFAKVRETLQKSQERQKKAADRHRRDLKLKENDWVLLRFEKARLRKKKGKERLYPKLSMRYYGPFQITERINDVSFRLRLPDTWKIHNAFHVSLLKPFRGNVLDEGEPDEQPKVEENEEILVPEHILAHKDTKMKVSGSEDGNVYFYDFTRPKHPCANKLQGHGAPVISVAWNYGENLLASSDCEGMVIVWKRASPPTSAQRENFCELHGVRIKTRNTHGTGCTLASAIAAEMAKGAEVLASVQAAKHYIQEALQFSKTMRIGKGPQGPLNHLFALPKHTEKSQHHVFKPSDLRLYAVTDSSMNRRWQHSTAEAVKFAIEGGATMVQLRELEAEPGDFFKEAVSCLEAAREHGVPLVINDRLDIAMALGADGVHLGQSDLPVHEARLLLGPDKIIGASCKTPEQAQKAYQDGANYVGCGGVYATTTKKNNKTIGLEGLRAVCEGSADCPVVAIGGINASNVEEVLRSRLANLHGVAVVSALFDKPDVVKETHKLGGIISKFFEL
ncbi:hypothetical protein L7F22_031475 [Adiantum nelumboides]|nr:hypothetical protein [Adiantum nelumboides]